MMYKAEIDVMPHEALLDPQGKAVSNSMKNIGLDSIENVKQGDFFATGTPLCTLGNYPENGEWAPHLHFQLITNLDDFNDGDYPAVCTQADKAKFAKYCPNPNLMLKIPSLD